MTDLGLIEARGRKDICKVVRVKSWSTARRILKNLGLLCYDGKTPVLNVEAFNTQSFGRHLPAGKK